MSEVFNHPMRSIPIEIIHTISATDFSPHHNWMMPGLRTARNDEATIRAAADETVADLASAGIPAHVVVVTHRNPYPSEW